MKKNQFRLILLLLSIFCSSALMAQLSIVGTVTDEKGETLPGVNVQVKGMKKGTITDIDGKFGISVGNASNLLIFTYIGYETKELKVDKSKPMQVILKEESKTLNEVMVIGYQDVRKKDLTGSVAKANIADMLKAPVATFDQALAGRLAGVSVSSNEGTPGGTMNIVIRGNNSVTQQNSPLYIIDGFPVEDPTIGSSINPNDIESIDVLKDASSTAIYGSRGANGVVIITTKKGVVGTPVITYDGSYGVQRTIHTIPLLNAYEFVKLQESFYTPADNVYYKAFEGKTYTREDYRNIEQFDWQDLILRDAPQQSHNISMTGGSAAQRYTASLSYFNQDGIVIASNYNRIQGRLGTTIRRNKLNINLTTNYSRITQIGSSPSQSSYSGMNNLFYSVWGYRPVTQPGKDINSLVDNAVDDAVNPTNDYRYNPILSLNNEYRKNTTNFNQYNGFLEYEFIKGLKLKLSGGYTTESKNNQAFNNSKTRYGAPTTTDKVNATTFTSERKTWLNENVLSYQTNINKVHSFNGLIGMSMQESDYSSYTSRVINIKNELLGMAGLDSGTPNIFTSPMTSWSMLSYLGRINYNYKSKYYLTASFRADGSSKFSKENRWGYYPSGSMAWNFTEEGFMKPFDSVIKSGKLRLSWGVTGNNRMDEYARFDLMRYQAAAEGNYTGINDVLSTVYPLNNNTASVGAALYSLGNQNLKWESTAQTNAGMDLSLLNDRIGLTVDWYNKVTSDLLLKAALPYSSGVGSVMKNIGKVQNRGLEFTINTTNIATKKFRWTSNFNISFNNNKVLELSDNQLSMLSNAYFDQSYTASNYIAQIGKPIGMMYGYIYEGTYKLDDFEKVGPNYVLKNGIARYAADASTQPGMPRYKDLNKDGAIDSNDQTIIGRGEPIHTGGFTNNFEYAGFDLSIFFQWSYGADVLNANRLLFEGGLKKRDLNQYASDANRWSLDNQTSNIPGIVGYTSNTLFSTRVIEDGSFLRLKTLSLGYSFSPKMLKKVKMSKARVYMSAQNLLTLTKYSGYDPEVSIRNSALTPGLDFSSYPRAFSMNMGLNITF